MHNHGIFEDTYLKYFEQNFLCAGWQELAAFRKTPNIPSDFLESADLQIFATEFCFTIS